MPLWMVQKFPKTFLKVLIEKKNSTKIAYQRYIHLFTKDTYYLNSILRRIYDCCNIQGRAHCEVVNYYHKELHLGCCSSPRSSSAQVSSYFKVSYTAHWVTAIHILQNKFPFRDNHCLINKIIPSDKRLDIIFLLKQLPEVFRKKRCS